MSRKLILLLSLILFASLTFAGAEVLTVTNTNFSGPGSIGQAILDANADPGASDIVFNIPGSGTHEISMGHHTGELPAITTKVMIDGANPTGTVLLSGAAPTGPGAPVKGLVFLAGSDQSQVKNINTQGFLDAIYIAANNMNVTGCNFNGSFARSIHIVGGMGILLDNNTFTNNDSLSIHIEDGNGIGILDNQVLSGNIILVDSTAIDLGLVGRANVINNSCQGAEAAVLVYGACSDIDVIGNVISDQTRAGVKIVPGTLGDHDIIHNTFLNNKEWDIIGNGDNLYIHGNQITGDPMAIYAGISVQGGDNVTVTGNTVDGARVSFENVTSGRMGGRGGEKNIIQNDPQGVSAYAGIMLKNTTNLLIWYNDVINNASNGIQLEASSNNEMYMNDIHSNGRTGIKIISGNFNKMSQNTIYDHHAAAQGGMDSISLLSGANQDIEAPVITSIVRNGDLLEISGTTSAANATIEVFVSDAPTSNFTQHAYDVLRTAYATGNDWSITCGVAEFSGPEAFVTATATDALNNTSELAVVASYVITDGIAGPTVVAPNVPYQYSVADIPNTQFTWWVGGDATIVGNGNSTVTITFSEYFTGGLVNVGYTDPVEGWVVKTLQVTPQ